MAERDAEIAELKARIASLEARPATTDLDWLKNSSSFQLAEKMTSPQTRRNGIIAVSFFWGVLVLGIVIAIIRNP